MIEEILQGFGLSKNESKIYRALIELGPATITEMCNKTHIHRRNTYDSLESLKGKGFVSSTIINNHNMHEATNPRILLDTIEEKKTNIESILPRLIAKQKQTGLPVKVYTGQKGRKAVFEDKLNYREEQYVIGAHEPSAKSLLFNENYHKRRIQKKIPLKMLFINKDKNAAKRVSKYGLVLVKILPKEFESPIAINIYANKTVIFLGSGTIDPVSILIEDNGMAKEFKVYFNTLWKISKPVPN